MFAVRYNRRPCLRALLDQDLCLRDIVWQRHSYSVGTHLAQYGKIGTWRYLCFALVVLIASDPVGLADHLPFAFYVLAWLLGMGCYIILQVAVLLGAAALRRLGLRLPVYGPLVAMLALAPTLLLLEVGLELGVGLSVRPFFVDRLAFLLITVVMLETIFLRFVMLQNSASDAAAAAAKPERPEPVTDSGGNAPRADASALAQDPALSAARMVGPSPQAEAERLLLIGAQPVPISSLICLEARQHHVLARQESGTLIQRARLSDIVAQTRAEEGLQPHRSWWVAAQALCQLERLDGKPVLRLRDGTLVPVARGRLADVERWLDARQGTPV